MSQTITINSALSLHRGLQLIAEAWEEHKFLRLSLKTGKDRSLSQNALSHIWYGQVSQQLREDTPGGVKRFCKLHYGVPILRAESDDFRAMYDAAIKNTMTYEQKLAVMEYLPVTSLMTKDQLSRYLQHMQAEYAKRGVQLEFPDEMEVA